MRDKSLTLKIKKLIHHFTRFFGFEIRRINSSKRIEIEQRKIGAERDEAGYDIIWSNKIFLEQYYNETIDYYFQLIDFLAEKNVMDGSFSIADIGSGPGNLLNLISKKWSDKKLYGFDFSSSAIKVAKINVPEAEFSQHNVYDPIFLNFDIVLCCETLEHLLYPDKALQNILNSTKFKCVLTVPDGRLDTYQGHINFWSEESWRCFIQNWNQDWIILHQNIGEKLYTIMTRRT